VILFAAYLLGLLTTPLLRWISARWQRSRPLILVPGGAKHERGNSWCSACRGRRRVHDTSCSGFIHCEVTGGEHDDPIGWLVFRCDRCGQTWEESPNV
jgi:hypothetical protein